MNATDVSPGATEPVAMVDPSNASAIVTVPPVTDDGDTVAVIVTDCVDSAGFLFDVSEVCVGMPTWTVLAALSLASQSANAPKLAFTVCDPADSDSSVDASPFESSGAGSPPPPSTMNMTAGMNPPVGCGAGVTCALTVNEPYCVPDGTSSVVVVAVAARAAIGVASVATSATRRTNVACLIRSPRAWHTRAGHARLRHPSRRAQGRRPISLSCYRPDAARYAAGVTEARQPAL